MGSDLHQTAIRNLTLGINEAAYLLQPDEKPVRWKALSQIALLGCQRPDGSLLRTYPDVLVYTRFVDPRRGSVSLDADGPPVLIAEVLSESTFESDVDVLRGKGYSYARAGVAEYITLDPLGTWIPELGRAWRLRDGSYQASWTPDKHGLWHSEAIPIAIGVEGAAVRVYTHDHRRMPMEGEISRAMARQAAEIAELRRRLGES